MFSLQHGLALEQLRHLDPKIRLIVIHPNFIQQHVLLKEFIADSSVVYVRFSGQTLTSEQMNQQLNDAAQLQIEKTDLGDLQTLILDECDRGEAKAFDGLLSQVIASVKKGRVVVFSRKPLRSIAAMPDLREITRFVPVSDDLMLWDYAHYDDEEKALLEVRALGAGWVQLNGEPIDEWDGLLPRSLFFFLVDKGMTTRNDIFETFWSTLTIREATNVFHVTKRKISEVLGVDLTSYWSGFYHVSPKIELSYDVVHFSEIVQNSGIKPPDEAAKMLRQAISLYRNYFLGKFELDWVDVRREDLERQYADALITLARMVEKDGNDAEALGLYLRAFKTTPHREDSAYNAMLLYRKMNMPQDALLVYERLRDELEEKFNVSPAKYIEELALGIQSD